jgi:hypothetical protein
MNIFAQFNREFLKDVVGIYIEDQETFINNDEKIIDRRIMTTTQGDWDEDYVNWKLYIVDLGSGDRGAVLVHKKPDEEFRY